MELPGLGLPLGTIWCVGRNYAEHARELGNAVPASPIVFLKPASSVVPSGGSLRLPADPGRVDHEVELVVARGADGSLKMAVGIDFPALGPFVPAVLPAALELRVNGAARQKGTTAGMLFPVEKVFAYLDAHYGPRPGDIVFTGTPSGVGPVSSGDRLEADLGGGASRLTLTVSAPG